MAPRSSLPLAKTTLQSLFPTTTVLPAERLICPAIASVGRKHNHFSRLFCPRYTFLGDLLNSPSPYIWAIQTLCSSQPALNHARKLADGCWQQARLCPHSAPVRKHQVILQQTELSLRKNSLTSHHASMYGNSAKRSQIRPGPSLD